MIVDVTPVRFRPHDDAYRLDVEVIRAKALRDRVASDPRRSFERVDFHCLLFVRSGNYTHRYRDYRASVDQHFRQWHLVTPYARHLGYSTKSLDRACRATSDATAKRMIVERIILEAKRILAHSSDPVARVSDDLGFDEPTNFVKYFKRATNLTPTRFRDSLLPAAEHSGA